MLKMSPKKGSHVMFVSVKNTIGAFKMQNYYWWKLKSKILISQLLDSNSYRSFSLVKNSERQTNLSLLSATRKSNQEKKQRTYTTN